ncbi:MAG: hypothetical protein GY820_18625 [Gammaproteobacteria bacterium]|nr:hypothetical protein [Gammaproteobacteria bacterium]
MTIDYKIDSNIRWGVLTDQINKFSREEKVQLILAAKNYQSGEGLLNTVYMGGLAIESLRSALNTNWRDETPWAAILEKATDKQLDDALQICMHTIEYMWAHPVSNCPCCGQIVPGDES